MTLPHSRGACLGVSFFGSFFASQSWPLVARGPPLGVWKIMKSGPKVVPKSFPFWRRLQTPSGTSGEAFGLDFGGDFGVDFGPPGATGHFCKKWHRATARAIFLVVRGGAKIDQKWRPKWLPAATRLQERLGRRPGTIVARF